MSLSPNHLAMLSDVAGSKRSGDVYTALEEIEAYVLSACAYLNERADKADELHKRLSDILADTLLLDTLGDALDDPAPWLTDEGEIQKHLTTLSDALDEWDGAA